VLFLALKQGEPWLLYLWSGCRYGFHPRRPELRLALGSVIRGLRRLPQIATVDVDFWWLIPRFDRLCLYI